MRSSRCYPNRTLQRLLLSCSLLAASGCTEANPPAPQGPEPVVPAPAPEPKPEPKPEPEPEPDLPEVPADVLLRCQDSDAAFVRRAFLAALGRRPKSQEELRFFTDLIHAVDEASPPQPGETFSAGRRYAALAMIKSAQPDYLRRWVDFYQDSLRIDRVGDMAMPACFAVPVHPEPRRVADRVRRETARVQGEPFSMLDVVLGALQIDDVSPMYIANLFAMLNTTFPGANADLVSLELSRRENFGARFNGAYLHRDVVCLSCHNSEASVTFDPDPEKNRHFPLPGLLEKSLFTESSGPPIKDGFDGKTRAFGVFRHTDFAFNGFAPGVAVPWGWDPVCGMFAVEVSDDLAGVDTLFGSVRGLRASMWDLSFALQRGFLALREHGLTRGAGGEVPDPDEAFAYLVSANIVEHVWKEVVGTPLTIANYFPRNAASRDELLRLTEAFVASGFSHIRLLLEIFRSPAFNLKAPESGCSDAPYAFAALFDPWVTAEEDASRRKNSVGDAVTPLSARTLLSAAYGALEWPAPSSFDFNESPFFDAIGVFVKDAQPGFRGLDFQARLTWENRFAECDIAPEGDFITQLLDVASTRPDAKISDTIEALKDRILGDPRLDDAEEREALRQLMDLSLDDGIGSVDRSTLETGLRRVCGVLLGSPQFMLGGVLPSDGAAPPKLILGEASYEKACERLTDQAPIEGIRVECTERGVVIHRD